MKPYDRVLAIAKVYLGPAGRGILFGAAVHVGAKQPPAESRWDWLRLKVA
jgi:hypothetical protein